MPSLRRGHSVAELAKSFDPMQARRKSWRLPLRRYSASNEPSGDNSAGLQAAEAYATRVHTQVTRGGVHLSLVALFAVLGGSVRGFNLLVIVAGMLIGLLIIQWRFCRATLPGLRVQCLLPPQVFAHRPFRVRYSVANHRRWLPSWMILLEDRIAAYSDPSTASGATCDIALIAPRSIAKASYQCTIRRRGRYRFGPVRLTTGFPLGLIQAWRKAPTHSTLVVYPEPIRLAPNWMGMLENQRVGATSSRRNSGPNEGEFFGIRQWQTGDSQRWIHWRTTARSGRLAVRQFEHPSRTRVILLVDPYLVDSADDAAVERMIRVAASMVTDLSAFPTNQIWFAIADGSGRALASHRMTDFRRTAMYLLATAKATREPPLAAALSSMLIEGNYRWPVLIISPRAARPDLIGMDHRGDTPTHNALPPAVLRALDVSWIDVTSAAGGRVAPGGVAVDGHH